ncbi:MAG: sodium:calcium antiporter [Saprospirales bacterium]|nr:MAG: sodium:calcium antiporter [Saprospirales bacterium]
MTLFLYLLMFVVSLAVLIKASDWFVMSSEKLGASWGASPFIIGLTIVAFGTSLPELSTAVFAMLEDQSEIVLGNIVGSNIANILLVLGILAVIAKDIKLDFDLFESDIPALVVSAFLLWFILGDGDIDTIESLILLAGLVVFIFSSISSMQADEVQKVSTGYKTYIKLVVSGALVYMGAKYTVEAIVVLSDLMGIGTDVISLTLVAVGTSLPEITVSIAAARKGLAGIAVGNVIGSNIFNTYIVLGVAGLMGPLRVTDAISDLSLPLMVGATIILAVSSLSKRITKWEGVLFLLVYVFFMYKLFL